MPAQPFKPDMGYIAASYSDPALSFRQLVKPGQEPYQRRFAGSRTAQNADRRSCRNGQRNMIQYRPRQPGLRIQFQRFPGLPGLRVRFLCPDLLVFLHLPGVFRITEGDIFEYNIAAHIRLFRSGQILLRPGVHDLPNPVQGYRGLAHLRDRLGQHTDRPGQHSCIRSQRNIITGADPPVYAEISPQHCHDHDLGGGDQIARRPEGGRYTGVIHIGFGIEIILGRKTLPLILLPSKGADDPYSGQIFLRDGRELSFLHIGVFIRRSDLITEIGGIQKYNRDEQRLGHSQHRGYPRNKIQRQHDQDHDPQHVDQLF